MNINFNIQQLITGFLFSLSVILLPIKGFISVIFIAVFIDTITGIAASIKNHGWSSLLSTKHFNLPLKLFVYCSVIIMFYFIDVHIFSGNLMDIDLLVTKSITVVCLYIEGKSFDENQKAFSGKSIAVWLREIFNSLKKLKKDFNDLSE